MKLSIKDRFNIPQLYEQSASIITQMLIRDIDKKVALDQEEIKKIELESIVKDGNASLKWNPEKAEDKEVEFNELELKYLKDQVTKFDNEKKITQSILTTCLLIQEYKKEKKEPVEPAKPPVAPPTPEVKQPLKP